MALNIRKAKAAELERVLDLYGAAFQGTARLTPAAARKVLRRMGKYPDYKLYVAYSGRKLVGAFELLIMDNLLNGGLPSALVEDVAVHPDWQGKGVGRRMMARAVELCRKAGCYKLALSSNLHRAAAHRFYRSLGFERHGYSFRIRP